MNVSVAPPGPQVYVEISSLSAQISSSNDVEDVHICGSCKRNFSDLDLFVEHKRAGCPAPARKALSTTMAPPHNQTSLGYVTTSTSNANDHSILGTQYLQIILDEDNLNIEGNQSHDQQLHSSVQSTSNTENQILRARLLGIAEQDTSVANHHNFQNTTELHTLVVGEQQQSNIKQREFQIDEEDVATLLANQLASEVVNSETESSIASKTGLINLSQELVPKSHNHFDLESMNLPDDTNENTVLKLPAGKSHTKERGTTKSNNPNSVTSGNVRWTNGNKSVSNKNNVPVSTSSSATGMINTTTNPTTVTTIATTTSTTTSASSNISSQVISSGNSVVIVDGPTGRKRHKCTQESCDFTTWYMKDLIRHVRKHTGERPFQCYSCNRTFSRLDKLHMHERIHTGEKRYRCKVCDYATHDSGSLRKHMRIHNDERPYKCQICPYRSRDSSQLTVHLRTHTGDNPFVCTFENCTSAFKTGSDLKRHSRIHTGEKPFSCSYCTYKCAIKSNLRVHIRLIHSEAKPIPCNSCNYVASTKRDVKEHEKTHDGDTFKCGICSYSCMNAAGMKSHCKIHNQDKSLSCKHCTFTCKLAASLKMHIKKKHPETFRKKHKGTSKDSTHDSPKNQVSRSGSSGKAPTHLKPFCVKSHKCTYCDAAFVREDSWRSHIRQHKNSLNSRSSTTVAASVTEPVKKQTQVNDVIPETAVTLEVHTQPPSKKNGEHQKCNVIPTDYLILGNNEDPIKTTDEFILPNTNNSANNSITTDSGIETSFVQYSVGVKNGKEPVPVVHQLNQEVLDGDNLQGPPILVYVQNPPVLHNSLDSNLRNAEIVTSINQSAPILVTSRCGQFLSVPLDQGGSLVEQFTSPLQQGMQYIVSTPFEGVVGGSTTYIQPLETTDSSGNAVSVVSFQLDKGSVVPARQGSN